jgi:hypothetical protein
MEKLVSAVKDWPVLIQGAIGSAIFWLVLLIGQRVAAYCAEALRNHSKGRRHTYLINELLRHNALREGDDFVSGAPFAALLWYRASRHVIVGFIWLSLGLIFDSIVGVFGVVGFVGCIYYLFAALTVVAPVNFEGDIDKKIEDLQVEISELEKGLKF